MSLLDWDSEIKEIEELIPDGSFETVPKCTKCGCEEIVYLRNNIHIQATCTRCGKCIKFVKQWNNDADWAREIKERANHTCQRCGKHMQSRQAVAHHMIPRWFMPGRKHDITNGICLCKECHKQIHGADGTIKEDEWPW